jgi:hypothetical protein
MKKIIQSLSETFQHRSNSITSQFKERNLYSHALLLMILLSVVMLPTGCKKDNEPTSTLNAQDRAFFDSAARSNLAEITLGNLAVSKGADNSIRAFGQMMVTMHTEQTNLLKTLADRKGVTLPTDLAPADRTGHRPCVRQSVHQQPGGRPPARSFQFSTGNQQWTGC